MSRIKFRAWDKDNKRWFKPGEFRIDGDGEVYFTDYDIPERWGDWGLQYELMQYTGLKDKNGVEIYESDIVAIQMYQVEDYIWEKGVIKWHQPSSAFKWFSVDGDPSDGNNYWLSQADEKGREVVGNIYETR